MYSPWDCPGNRRYSVGMRVCYESFFSRAFQRARNASSYIITRDRLIRFSVVAVYQRNDSSGVSLVIQPDQSIMQIIEKESRVSSARNAPGA